MQKGMIPDFKPRVNEVFVKMKNRKMDFPYKYKSFFS